MLYLSIALVLMTTIICFKPPSITIHRKHELIQPPPLPQPEETEEEKVKEPSPYDTILKGFNEIFHGLGGEDHD